MRIGNLAISYHKSVTIGLVAFIGLEGVTLFHHKFSYLNLYYLFLVFLHNYYLLFSLGLS
jgi:hypothetical protein